jgi:carbon storage regulator
MLILTRTIGTAVMIGDHIVLKVIQVNGDKVRLGIEAPRETQIQRTYSIAVKRWPRAAGTIQRRQP